MARRVGVGLLGSVLCLFVTVDSRGGVDSLLRCNTWELSPGPRCGMISFVGKYSGKASYQFSNSYGAAVDFSFVLPSAGHCVIQARTHGTRWEPAFSCK